MNAFASRLCSLLPATMNVSGSALARAGRHDARLTITAHGVYWTRNYVARQLRRLRKNRGLKARREQAVYWIAFAEVTKRAALTASTPVATTASRFARLVGALELLLHWEQPAIISAGRA